MRTVWKHVQLAAARTPDRAALADDAEPLGTREAGTNPGSP